MYIAAEEKVWEAAPVLIAKLQQNPARRLYAVGEECVSAEDMIDQLSARTPRGRAYLEAWLERRSTVEGVMTEVAAQTVQQSWPAGKVLRVTIFQALLAIGIAILIGMAVGAAFLAPALAWLERL